MFKNQLMGAAAAALSLVGQAATNRIFGFHAIQQYVRRQSPWMRRNSGSIATGNRHGGAHQHLRQRARLARQGKVAQA